MVEGIRKAINNYSAGIRSCSAELRKIKDDIEQQNEELERILKNHQEWFKKFTAYNSKCTATVDKQPTPKVTT